ncbi:hypothetical protein DFJ73DRAFT_807541 [Zopfochytrium polystomum]|nr:hypothetical protein DFJ73DRAFT_807541 [Zopfochytrium polystomum]
MHPNATATAPLAPTSDGVKRFMSALAYGASDRHIKMTTTTKDITAARASSSASTTSTTPEPTTPTASVARSTTSSSKKSTKTKVALRRLAESLAYGASDRHIKLSPAMAPVEVEEDESVGANGETATTPSVSDASEASAAKRERFDRLMASLAYGASDRHIRPIR